MVFAWRATFCVTGRWLRNSLRRFFSTLHQNLHSIKSPEHLTFWLRKVTSHRCIDQARRQKVRPQVSLEDVPEPVAKPTENDLFLSEMLRRVVDTLPEKARLVVILRYQEDLDPAEIAKVLDMPLNTVKSHLRRSLSMLRDKLSRTLGEVTI